MNSNSGFEPGEDDSESRRLAKGFILGSLSEDEQLEFDARFIGTPTFADLAYEVETDLIDAYAAGRLEPGEREVLHQWSLKNSRNAQRLRSAEALHKVLVARSQTAAGKLPEHFRRDQRLILSPVQMRWAAGIAAVVLVVIGTLLFRASLLHRSRGAGQALQGVPSAKPAAPLPEIAASTPPQLPPKPPAAKPGGTLSRSLIFTASLLADESRGDAAAQTIALPAGTGEIRLQLSSEIDIPRGYYSVILAQALSDQIIWQNSRLYHAGTPFVTVNLGKHFLANGAYVLTLRPASQTANGEPLTFRFRIAQS